jgi:RNA polymerase sigma factor (sigma-70 family)
MDTLMTLPEATSIDAASARYLRYAQTRDVSELDALLRDHIGRGYAQARRMLGNASDAEDAVQEAVLQVLRGASRYDGAVPFAACWARLVHVACRRTQLSRSRRDHHEAKAKEMTPTEASADNAVDIPELHNVLRELGDSDQAAIDLHYFAGLDQRTAAAALGLSENAFSVRLHRAREKLRGLLARRGTALTGAVLAATLAQTHSYATPTALLAKASALLATAGSAAALPSTTIPLGKLPSALLAVKSHPFIAAGLALVISASAFMAVQDAPTVIIPEATCWSGPARELLNFIDPNEPSRFAIDFDYVRTVGAHAKPTSLLSDASVAPNIAHIMTQLDAMRSFQPNRYPPVWRFWNDAHGLVMNGNFGADAPIRMAVVADAGLSNAELHGWYDAMSAKSVRIYERRFAAIDLADYAWEFYGRRTAVGQREQVAAAVARSLAKAPIPPAWLDAPIQLRLDISDMIAFLDRFDRNRDDALQIGQFFPSWRSAKPVLSVTSAPKDGCWTATSRLDGVAGIPVAPVRGDFIALVEKCELGGLAIHVREDLIATLLRVGTRLDITAVEKQLSGDVALLCNDRFPIPHLTVVLGIKDSQACKRFFEGTSVCTKLPEAPNAWELQSLVYGRLRVTLLSDCIYVSGEDRPIHLKGPKSSDGATWIRMHLDLPRIAELWWPLLRNAVPEKGTVMPQLSIPIIDGISGWNMMYASSLESHPFTRLSEFTDEHIRHNGPALIQSLSAGLTGDINTVLDTCFSCYTNGPVKHDANARFTDDRTAVVYRLPDGLHLAEYRHDHGLDEILSVAELSDRLRTFRKISGPDPAQLALLPLVTYDFPRFDRRWLPDTAVVVRNLAPYDLSGTYTDDTLTLQERGLPLAAVGAVVAIGAVPANREDIEFQYYRKIDQDAAKIVARHPAKVAVAKKIAAYVDGVAKPVLAPSGLVTNGSMAIEEFAPLFADRSPSLEELDRAGEWVTLSADRTWFSHWRLELEPGWYVFISPSRITITSNPAGDPFGHRMSSNRADYEQAKPVQPRQGTSQF